MINMIELIQLLVIASVLQVIVADLSKINDAQTCMEFCSTSGNVGNFKEGYCVCDNLDNTETENVIRDNRQAEYVDPISYSNDLTNEDRTIRCALRSRKHMRHHDADRVVTYFVNDGPANGHAYFIQAANQNIDTEKECKNNKYPSTNSYRNSNEPDDQVPAEQPSMTENYSKRSYSDAIGNAPYNPYYNPMYFLPHDVPITPVAPVVMNPYVTGDKYGTVTGPINNMLSHSIDIVHGALRDNLVGSKLLSKIRSRSNLLKHVSNALVGIVKEPENESILGTFINHYNTPDLTVYSLDYNNNKSVIHKNDGSEIKQVNSIVGSTNENGEIPTANSEIPSQGNIQISSETKKPTNSVPSIQRTNISPRNFQSAPYNQEYFMSMYPSQQYPISGSFNTMPIAYFLHPVNIIPQGIDSKPQSETISSSRLCESLDRKKNSYSSTNEYTNAFQTPTTTSNNQDNSMDFSYTTTRNSNGATSTSDFSIIE